jgi:hypothetical protein
LFSGLKGKMTIELLFQFYSEKKYIFTCVAIKYLQVIGSSANNIATKMLNTMNSYTSLRAIASDSKIFNNLGFELISHVLITEDNPKKKK